MRKLRRRQPIVESFMAVRLLPLAALLAFGLTAPALAQDKPIKIALIQDKTGPLEAYAKQVVTGFTLGLEYATKGTMTVAGRKVEVIEKDSQTKPDVGRNLLSEAYGDDNPLWSDQVYAEGTRWQGVIAPPPLVGGDSLVGEDEVGVRIGQPDVRIGFDEEGIRQRPAGLLEHRRRGVNANDLRVRIARSEERR